MRIWAIKDRNGCILHKPICASKREVGRKVLNGRYDAFRLQVSSSYREMFNRALKQALAREGWQIVRIERSDACCGDEQ